MSVNRNSLSRRSLAPSLRSLKSRKAAMEYFGQRAISRLNGVPTIAPDIEVLPSAGGSFL